MSVTRHEHTAAESASGSAPLTAQPSRPALPRIALVLSRLTGGGMERVVAHLARGLIARGAPVLVICVREEGPLAREFGFEPENIVSLDSDRGYDLRALFRLARILRRFRPDVINVHDYSSLPYVSMAALVVPRCPIVMSAHGLLYSGFESRQRRYRFFSRRVRALTAVSERVRRRHLDYLNWRGPLHLIPNGVPDRPRCPTARDALRAQLGLEPDDFGFLAVGNVRPEKGFEDLVAASRLMAERNGRYGRVRILVAGHIFETEYARDVVDSSKRGGEPQVTFLGFRSDAQQLYSAADAFVISSRSEGLPMVLLEAMTTGLPVIATRVGGIPDAVPDGGGVLVDPAAPDQLAAAMLRMVESDRKTLTAQGSTAREWAVAHYGVERMIDRYLECFDACIGNRTGARP